MSSQFHHSDTPPQVYLDQLHEMNIPRLYDPGLNESQRSNLLTLSRKRLSDWQTRIVDQTKNVELRYKHIPDHARLYAAPYKKLAALGNDLTRALGDLERTVRAGKAVPRGFEFGTKIYGTFDTGEWRLGDAKDAKRWEQMEAIRRRLDLVHNDFEPMKRDMDLALRRAKETKQELKKLHKRHRILRSKFPFLGMLVLVIVIVVGTLLGGITILNGSIDIGSGNLTPIFGASMLMVSVVAAVLSFSMVRRRRLEAAHVQLSIADAIEDYRSHKVEAREIRLQLYPVAKLAKQLTKEYKDLRQTFPD
jgi:hypothetical protein